jgi:hypothetical protein
LSGLNVCKVGWAGGRKRRQYDIDGIRKEVAQKEGEAGRWIAAVWGLSGDAKLMGAFVALAGSRHANVNAISSAATLADSSSPSSPDPPRLSKGEGT